MFRVFLSILVLCIPKLLKIIAHDLLPSGLVAQPVDQFKVVGSIPAAID